MPKFVVEMKRTQTAQVTVEAKSEYAARKMLANEDVRWEYFTAEGDGYVHGDIKIVSIKPKEAA